MTTVTITPTPKQTATTELVKYLPFTPSAEQVKALSLMEEFVSRNSTSNVFILKGQAGTGKTSLIPSLIQYLQTQQVKVQLAAPTGRAAQVIAGKCDVEANTLHSILYLPEVDEKTGQIKLHNRRNEDSDETVFIIDESSMVSDVPCNDWDFATKNSLLHDLIAFVRGGNSCNKIIFVGDPYQLVLDNGVESPALCVETLFSKYQLICDSIELTEIKRQGENSPIITYASSLRQAIKGGSNPGSAPYGLLRDNWSFYDHFTANYDNADLGDSIIVCQSNKSVNASNSVVRKRIFGFDVDARPKVGDTVLVNQNWYHSDGVVLNGTLGVIEAIDLGAEQNVEGIHFLPATISFQKGKKREIIKTLIVLETLLNETGKLSAEENKRLFAYAMRHNSVFRSSKAPWDDRYIGAMRLRYGYALTCHKAQGGEWKRVYINPFHSAKDYRWVYTAITRASEKLFSFIIN